MVEAAGGGPEEKREGGRSKRASFLFEDMAVSEKEEQSSSPTDLFQLSILTPDSFLSSFLRSDLGRK